MRPFNLAETKILERSFCKQHLNRRLRNIALLVVLMGLVAVVSCACRMSVSSKAQHIKSDLANVQARCVAIKRDIAVTKIKSCERKWQDTLAEGSKRWLNILDNVLGRVPSDVWLNRMENSDSNSSITLEGQAASFVSLSAFMGALRCSPLFSEVVLNGTKVTGLGAATFVEFSLSIKLKAPGNAAAAQPEANVPPAGEAQ